MPAILLGMFTWVSLVASAQEQSPKSKTTVWDGVYTADQSKQGRTVYTAKCGACHKEDLSGYDNILKGDRFMDHWREDSLESFYRALKGSMPRDAPGSLSDDAYLQVTAYILEVNGFPSGAVEMKNEHLARVRVERKSGPSAVATGALVELVGCLTDGPDGKWKLVSASEPVRTRDPNSSSADDLKARTAQAPGAHTFGLLDAALYNPDSHKGHRVEAKGFMIRRSGGDDAVNLTALQTISPGCAP